MLSKWFISPKGEMIRFGRIAPGEPLSIIHLDDHKLFTDGLLDTVIWPFFPNARVQSFHDASDACVMISRLFQCHTPPDLIITDISHPGMDGLLVSKWLRSIEQFFKAQARTPVMILTMMDIRYLGRLQERDLNAFDKYISKAANPEDIANCIEELIYG